MVFLLFTMENTTIENDYSVYDHIIPDGMHYYGTTNNIKERFRPSTYKTTSLRPYIEKYGWENIQHIVLFENLPKEDALSIEDSLIVSGWEKGNCINQQRSGYVSKKEGYTREYYEQHKDEIKQYREQHKDEHKEYNRKYYEQNKDKIQERKKQYYEQHKDEIKQYREQNKEQILERKKQYYEQNKDKWKEYYEQNKEQIKTQQKQYREQNKDKISEYQRQYQREYQRKYRQRKKQESQLNISDTPLF